jgi:hypothetical protein
MLARQSAAALALAGILVAGGARAEGPGAPPLASPTPAGMTAQAPPPPPPPVQVVPTEPRSSTMMIGGIVMAATGGALLHFAALYPVLHEDSCSGGACSNERSISGGMALAGVVAIAVGVPLLVVGARQVPVRAALLGAPGGAGWVWRF